GGTPGEGPRDPPNAVDRQHHPGAQAERLVHLPGRRDRALHDPPGGAVWVRVLRHAHERRRGGSGVELAGPGHGVAALPGAPGAAGGSMKPPELHKLTLEVHLTDDEY